MAWDEAREVLVVVLLLAALLNLIAPMIYYVTINRDTGFDGSYPLFSWWSLAPAFGGVNISTGLLLLGAGVAVCTTPAADMVPRLRQWVFWISVAVTALGGLAIVNFLTSSFPGFGVGLRLLAVLEGPAPAALLSGAAAWMARRVVLLG